MPSAADNVAAKHIAIVGYGSACLMQLKLLQDLPHHLRKNWRVTIFERREALGGQWLPDTRTDAGRSSVALTGLYPDLRTNTPVHMMTFPHTPFPDHTDLFPHWSVVLKYLQDYAQTWGLYDSDAEDWGRSVPSQTKVPIQNGTSAPYANGHNEDENVLQFRNTLPEVARKELPRRILFNRELYSAKWEGSTEPFGTGRWKTISRRFPAQSEASEGTIEEYEDTFDAIIDATGHFVYPSIVHWKGEDDWLRADQGREIVHSIFYRGPAAFEGRTVLIIGAGPSGLDGALQIATSAKKVYHSVTPTVVLPPTWPFERKVRISHFTSKAIVFDDGTELHDVDTVYLGTGFVIRYPHLERGGVLQRRPGKALPALEDEQWSGLVSTDLYVRPLYEHTVSCSSLHGPASLFWNGNIMSTSYRFSNAVQGALIAWSLALPDILPSKDDMLRGVREEENRTKALGRSVEKVGHRQGRPHEGESEVYQRRIVSFLKNNGIEIGNAGRQEGLVMEPWREEVRKDFWQCMRGWRRIEKEGRSEEFLWEAVGEEGFARVSRKVIAEQKVIEKDRNVFESEISGWE